MIRAFIKLHMEALRLLTIYEKHKNSEDQDMRRKVHVSLDRFLMENRETAILLMEQGLKAEIDKHRAARKTAKRDLPWYKRLRLKGGAADAGNN